MPSFISKNGKWEAAKERAYNPETDQMETMPDRAAVEMLRENGDDIGQNALLDPQNLQAARNMGFNTVEEMFKVLAPSPKEVEAIKSAQEKIVTHKDEIGKPSVDRGTLGGFNDEETSPLEAMESKKRGRPRKS